MASVSEPRVWPRTASGHCSCPYCTAVRDGSLPPPPESKSIWEKRVTGATNPLRNADWGDTP